MSDKKHIDRLFQEKFKDFEATPNDAVWERIEAQLKEKKKRKVVPIWWRYAGVAALLLLLLTIGNSYFNNNESLQGNPNQVVDTEEIIPSYQIEHGTNNGAQGNSINNAITGNTTSEDVDKKSNNLQTTRENQWNQPNATAVAKGKSNGNNNTVEYLEKSNNTLQSKDQNENPVELAKTSEDKTNNPSEIQGPTIDKTKIDNQFNRNKNSTETDIADVITNPEDTNVNDNKQHTLTIEEAIELAKNNNEESKEDLNRWSVAPNAAPVFFNSLGKGSSIDPQFNNNSKSSETNMSYGVSASYAVNKRISVRSGINKVSLGYNTNNVVAFQTMGSRSGVSVLKNVKPELNSAYLNDSGNDVSILSSENFANKSSQDFATTSGVNTSINQSLSFIEIPLEIKYMLSDKKLGINVIGGFSSFFLNDNELHSNFEGNKIFIGEASNINKTSYSANFGFGLDYKVSKKINLNLEPMFKYQINTFNNTSGNFKPYFLGVYTGFGFKF